MIDPDVRSTLRIARPQWSDERIERAARQYEQANGAPSSAPKNTTKRRAPVRTEKNMSENKIVVKTLAELFALVEKGIGNKGVKVYMPQDGEIVEVDVDAVERLLQNLAGVNDDEQMFDVTPPAAGAKFPTATVPMSGDGVSGDWPLRNTPYGVVEGNPLMTRLPGGSFIASNLDPGIAEPLNFDAPEPGDNPATGEPVPDLSKPGSPIFKSEVRKYKTTKGLWDDVVRMAPGDLQHGQG